MEGKPSRLQLLSTRVAKLVTRSPRAVLAGVALVTACFASQLPRLHIDQSAEGILLQNDPERARVSELAATFGLDEILIVAVHAEDGVFTPATLAKLRRLGESIASIDGVAEVVSLANAQYISGAPEGLSIAALVPSTPLDEADLARIRERALSSRLYLKHLVSGDGRTAALNVFLEDRPADRDYRATIVAAVHRAIEREAGPETLYLAGIPRTKVALAQQLLRDVLVLTPITLAVLTAIMLVCFGTLRGVVLPATTIGIALIWTLGGLALSGASISLVTNGLPGMVQILGTSYVIFLMGGYYESVAAGADGESAAFEMIERVGPAVVVSAATTAVGFLSLSTSDVATVKSLGVFGAFGVLASMVLGLSFVPAVLAMLPARPMNPPRFVAAALDGLLLRLLRATQRHPAAILVGFALAAILSGLGISRIYVETDYTSYLPDDSEVHVSSRRISEELSGSVPLYVVVEGEAPGAVLEPSVLRKIAELQRAVEAIGGVDATLSLADYVEVIHRELNDGRPAEPLPGSLDEATQCLGLYHVFSPTDELWHYVSEDRRRANVMVRTHLLSSTEMSAAIDEMRARAGEIFAGDPVRVSVTGTMVLINKTGEAISRGQISSLLASFVGVAAILWLAFRSVGRTSTALPSNMLPVAIPYGIMGFLGIPLSTGTSLVGALVFGISVDDTVHYLMRYQRERASGKDALKAVEATTSGVGRPMLFTAIALSCGFSVLLASGFSPMRAFGGLTAVTWVVAVLTDLLLLPVLLIVVDAWGRARDR